MAEVSAKDAMKLRQMTGAGVMDCKKALAEADGDMDKAVELLREKGLAKAAKKADRIAAEGICATNVSVDNQVASIVEVNSETDFVAKNEKFRGYVAAVAAQAAKTNAADIDAFNETKKKHPKTIAISQSKYDELSHNHNLDKDTFYWVFDKETGKYINGYMDIG